MCYQSRTHRKKSVKTTTGGSRPVGRLPSLRDPGAVAAVPANGARPVAGDPPSPPVPRRGQGASLADGLPVLLLVASAAAMAAARLSLPGGAVALPWARDLFLATCLGCLLVVRDTGAGRMQGALLGCLMAGLVA